MPAAGEGRAGLSSRRFTSGLSGLHFGAGIIDLNPMCFVNRCPNIDCVP